MKRLTEQAQQKLCASGLTTVIRTTLAGFEAAEVGVSFGFFA